MRFRIVIDVIHVEPLTLEARCFAHADPWTSTGDPEYVFAWVREHMLEEVGARRGRT